MISAVFRAQVQLLLRILPAIAREEVFGLKGGTAINLFVRDMPRLSVDIDLTYARTSAFASRSSRLSKIKPSFAVSSLVRLPHQAPHSVRKCSRRKSMDQFSRPHSRTVTAVALDCRELR